MPEYEKKTDKERVAEITDKLENGIKDLVNGDNFKKYLATMSKFHNYSFNNTMLIAMQKPDASLVAGYNTWKNKFERSVNRGEKGIQIFAPSPYTICKEKTKLDKDTQLPVLDKDGKPITEEIEVKIPAFKVVSVFDVSQTNGKELPALGADELTGNVKDFEKFFSALKEVSPVPIEFEKIESGAKGYFSRESQKIAINEGMSEVQTIKTAVHEIAHSKLHDRALKKSDIDEKPKDRNTEEVEAESIAFTVCTHFGIDTSDYSFGYVASWGSGKEVPELKSSLETIRATSNELINSITAVITKEQEKTAEQPDKSNIIGNTAYSAIEDKQYFRLKSSTAEKVAEYLMDKNIPFSGRINGDKTTLTIGQKNVDDYKAAIAAVTGREKPQKEKVSEVAEKLPEQPKVAVEPHPHYDDKFILKEVATDGTLTTGTKSYLIDFCKEKLAASVDIPQLTDMIDKVEQARPKVNHFDIPVILQDIKSVRCKGESAIEALILNNRENKRCNDAIVKAISYNLTPVKYGVHFEAQKAAEQVLSEFPLDRVALVTAFQVIHSKDYLENTNFIDGRYGNDVQEWAIDKMTQVENFPFDNFRDCHFADKSHPVLVDSFAKKVIQKELEVEKAINEAVVEDVQREICTHEYGAKMPDDSVTIADRNSFGYTWDGMLPLSTGKALELFANDQNVYLLHEDNTESLAVSIEDIEQHRGMYGIEKEEWSKFLDINAHYRELADKEPEYEAQLFSETDKAVGIYQLNDNPDTRSLCFEPLKSLQDKGISPNKENYTLVYALDVSDDKQKSDEQLLEDVYEKFNIERPKDFKGHSLSVSDIVVIQDKGNISSHYCDTVGFSEIAFLEKDRANLQMNHIEDVVEQNDNNFDGIINNTPSMSELEEKVRQGESILLTDMCKAIRNEREKPEIKPDRKPSIHDKLRQAKERQHPTPKDKDAQTKKGMEI